jgi:adenylate kinase family enzyme
MKKVVVLGGSGSGKSTFARKLCAVTRLPLYHLDNLFWNKDKTHVSREVFDRRLDVILSYDRYIIDGEYGRTIERRIAAADTVFFFDIPLEDRLSGAVARVGTVHPDLPWTEESFDPEFEKWIRDYDTDQRPVTLALLEKYKEKEIIIFKSRKESDLYFSK